MSNALQENEIKTCQVSRLMFLQCTLSCKSDITRETCFDTKVGGSVSVTCCHLVPKQHAFKRATHVVLAFEKRKDIK